MSIGGNVDRGRVVATLLVVGIKREYREGRVVGLKVVGVESKPSH